MEIKTKDISVIIPIYNESTNIEELYNRLKNTLSKIVKHYELIFVNDGSKDDSLLKLIDLSQQDSNVFYVNLTRNFGHQIAVSAGLNYCNAETVVIIDADLQDPPELISELYAEHQKGFDVVYAKRRKRKGETLFKRITAKLYYRILKRMVPFEIPLDTGDFRLISKKVVKALQHMPEQNKFLRGQIAWLGFKQSYVLFDRASRKKGKSAYTYSKMFRLAIDGITGFSDKPLLWVSRLGFLISFFAFLLIIMAVISHFILERTITGWTSLIISAAFLGGIQLLSIGVIGEYISRINRNTINRPLYMIETTNVKLDKSL
ncbi:glycosyltransferase family 2 protein [Winogradskyella immobilis]|uniref:Glycosyltransferase family 2 protein n=1 Tax=Winogradskyella immobilis TaxID=2816852 RepID=A0ABS8EME0_9FLAO|nr:glycosyltransferase family 2 protein [Winogradskyella immobilis]MCC1484091.1 glycosyltransferase family 2 protein [Winogradskyella immobilis]MCG0016183.1 glycosyltransferase family 2 protein [Winogradskyella immobilis]